MPAGRSTGSRSTAPIIRSSDPIPSPGGMTKPRKALSSPSRAAGSSRTSNSSTTLMRRSPISSPSACCASRRSWALSCGNSRRGSNSTPRASSISSRCCRGTRTAAAALAERHDQRFAGRAWTRIERRRKLRRAIEIRHPSFLDPDFVALLRRQRIALVFAELGGLALCRGLDRRLRLSAPARFRGTLRERLFGRGARPLGGADQAVGPCPRTQRCRGWPSSPAGGIADRGPVRHWPWPDQQRRRLGRHNDAKVRAPVDARSLRSLASTRRSDGVAPKD